MILNTVEEFENLGLSDKAINTMLYGLYVITGRYIYASAIWYTWEDMENEFAFTVPQMINLFQDMIYREHIEDFEIPSDATNIYKQIKKSKGGRLFDGKHLWPCSVTDSVEYLYYDSEILTELLLDLDNIDFTKEVVEKINQDCKSDSPLKNVDLLTFLRENIK